MMYARNTRKVCREMSEQYRGRPMCIEVGPDGVFIWPKGTRQKTMVSLGAAYERSLAHQAGVDTSPARKELGMSVRKRTA